MSVLARLLPTPSSAVGTRAPTDGQRGGEPGEQTHDRWSVRRVWRSFRGVLSDYHWYVLGVAGVVAFILGCIGWWRYLPGHYPKVIHPYSDVAYWSFKDFFINSPADPNLPWQLDVARFLAPVVAGWAGLSGLGLLFRDRVQQMRIPMMRGHVVVCGLGDYVGTVFLRHLQETGVRVVVIELDPDNPNIELCRGLGVPVIVGDAQRLRTLQAAGARRASRVLVVTGDDTVNTQIVAGWRQLPDRRSRELGCMARISDPEFSLLLWIQELQRGDAQLSVDFFNIDEISARLLLEDFPIKIDNGQPHIIVAHLDPLGVWLVYHAARAWYDNRGDSTDKLVVTVIDHNPQERVEALLGQHPALDEACQFISTYSASAKDIGQLADHHRDPATPPISRAYVTAYRDQQAFETALRLRHQLDPSITVVVGLSHRHGVAGLLDDVKGAEQAGALANIEVFATMERACTAEFVRGGSFELMARAIHERWRTEQIRDRKPATGWEDLDESRKESSRAQARDIPVKLRLVDCALTPLRRWDARDFHFTDEEVTTLSIEEHERWNDERRADGWTLVRLPKVDDPEEEKRLRDDAKRRKQTEYLVSWEDLPPDIAEYDSMFVRAIPDILASAGLQIVRTNKPSPTATEQAEQVG